MHIVLLGDSVFDNLRYVEAGEPDVTLQVERLLAAGERVTRLAVDGHVADDVHRQLSALPGDATHLFVSVGGNDALGHLDLFQRPAGTVGEALLRLRHASMDFERRYRRMLDACVETRRPVIISTIYYPRFDRRDLSRLAGWVASDAEGETLQAMAMAALPAFNDVILREASARGLDVLDLRVLCGDDDDFANPIEPSATGGDKIARAIVSRARSAAGASGWARLISSPPSGR